MVWQPILDPAAAAAAGEAIEAIGDALDALPPGAYDASGTALFWAYAQGVVDPDRASSSLDLAIERVIAELVDGMPTPALYGGIAGAAAAIAHTCVGADDLLDIVDRELVQIIERREWVGGFDLIRGAVGFGVYFFERLTQGSTIARAGIAKIVEYLDATREDHGDTIAWRTALIDIPVARRDRYPDGYYDCGVAHGVPGIVGFLARVVELGDAPPRSRCLLDGAMRWLWSVAHARAIGFDPWLAPSQPRTGCRAAWCYGDPGVATALWSAAVRSGTSATDAIALAKTVTSRTSSSVGAQGLGLCHGAAGLAHLFNRHYQASGDPVFRDAARTWFAHTLDTRRDGGLGGFGEEARLLDGAAGIGLALIAAITPREPAWDRLLLADLPPLGTARHATPPEPL